MKNFIFILPCIVIFAGCTAINTKIPVHAVASAKISNQKISGDLPDKRAGRNIFSGQIASNNLTFGSGDPLRSPIVSVAGTKPTTPHDGRYNHARPDASIAEMYNRPFCPDNKSYGMKWDGDSWKPYSRNSYKLRTACMDGL